MPHRRRFDGMLERAVHERTPAIEAWTALEGARSILRAGRVVPRGERRVAAAADVIALRDADVTVGVDHLSAVARDQFEQVRQPDGSYRRQYHA